MGLTGVGLSDSGRIVPSGDPNNRGIQRHSWLGSLFHKTVTIKTGDGKTHRFNIKSSFKFLNPKMDMTDLSKEERKRLRQEYKEMREEFLKLKPEEIVSAVQARVNEINASKIAPPVEAPPGPPGAQPAKPPLEELPAAPAVPPKVEIAKVDFGSLTEEQKLAHLTANVGVATMEVNSTNPKMILENRGGEDYTVLGGMRKMSYEEIKNDTSLTALDEILDQLDNTKSYMVFKFDPEGYFQHGDIGGVADFKVAMLRQELSNASTGPVVWSWYNDNQGNLYVPIEDNTLNFMNKMTETSFARQLVEKFESQDEYHVDHTDFWNNNSNDKTLIKLAIPGALAFSLDPAKEKNKNLNFGAQIAKALQQEYPSATVSWSPEVKRVIMTNFQEIPTEEQRLGHIAHLVGLATREVDSTTDRMPQKSNFDILDGVRKMSYEEIKADNPYVVDELDPVKSYMVFKFDEAVRFQGGTLGGVADFKLAMFRQEVINQGMGHVWDWVNDSSASLYVPLDAENKNIEFMTKLAEQPFARQLVKKLEAGEEVVLQFSGVSHEEKNCKFSRIASAPGNLSFSVTKPILGQHAVKAIAQEYPGATVEWNSNNQTITISNYQAG